MNNLSKTKGLATHDMRSIPQRQKPQVRKKEKRWKTREVNRTRRNGEEDIEDRKPQECQCEDEEVTWGDELQI